MEDLVMKFKTKYDFNAIKTFNKYNMYHKSVTWIITIIAILIIIISICLKSMETMYRITCCVIGITWILEIIFLPVLRAKSVMKTSNINKDAVVELEFKKEDIFMITKRKEDIISTSVMKYEDIYKVCNANDYIYVYISKDQAILCSKENMTGKYSNFIKFLKGKIGKRYKGK